MSVDWYVMSTFIKHVLVFAVLSMVLSGCSSQNDTSVLPTQSSQLFLEEGDLSVSLGIPTNWTGFIDSNHLILTQFREPINPDGTLNGIIVNVWLPQRNVLSEDDPINLVPTSDLLRQITNLPDLIGTAVASTPQPINSTVYDGAYYVLNNGDGNATLVLAITPRDSEQLVAFNVIANIANFEAVLPSLETILMQMSIRDREVDQSILEVLPDEIIIPPFETNQSAMESTTSP
jgi:hypothetical protein